MLNYKIHIYMKRNIYKMKILTIRFAFPPSYDYSVNFLFVEFPV